MHPTFFLVVFYAFYACAQAHYFNLIINVPREDDDYLILAVVWVCVAPVVSCFLLVLLAVDIWWRIRRVKSH